MTTTLKTKQLTTFTVTMGFAPEEWKDEVAEDGSINYDTQPLASRTVQVELPSTAAPWEVYEAADELVDDESIRQEFREQGAYGLDGDGFSIYNSTTGLTYDISYDSIDQDVTWDKFFVH